MVPRLEKIVPKKDSLPENINEMHRILCFNYILNFLGLYGDLDDNSRINLANKLITYYDHSLQFGSDLTSTEPQPADSFLLLAVEILTYNKTTIDDKLVFQLLAMFQRALEKSPSNFYMKLTMLQLYNHVGAVGASQALFDSMDIKHIMYDSLGHLMVYPLMNAAHFSTASQLLGCSLRFYSANFKDVSFNGLIIVF